METTRFETFVDAIIAIIMTVMVLKLSQPQEASLTALWDLRTMYLVYFISFLTLFNIWYNNHNIFQHIDTIDNSVVWIHGIMIFVISLLPYFTTWIALNTYSLAAETMFGLIFVATNILYNFSIHIIYKSNPYNDKLSETNFKSVTPYLPLILIIIGFVLTYTLFVPAIYITCLVAVLIWVFINRYQRSDEKMDSERFEALIDALLAIIITIIVLEIPLAANGSWDALFEERLEFIAYAVSFIVVFNFWNFNNNMFSIVNKIDHKVIWSIGASLFMFSMLPYLTTFVSENFYSFTAQCIYAVDFLLVALTSIITSNALKEADKANIALQIILDNNYMFYSTFIIIIIGIIIGYFLYPPAIIMSCLVSIVAVWFVPKITCKFR